MASLCQVCNNCIERPNNFCGIKTTRIISCMSDKFDNIEDGNYLPIAHCDAFILDKTTSFVDLQYLLFMLSHQEVKRLKGI